MCFARFERRRAKPTLTCSQYQISDFQSHHVLTWTKSLCGRRALT